jgi:hypothetical protein
LQQKLRRAIVGEADRGLFGNHRRVGEEKTNGDNTQFKNRRNRQKIKHIAFSNRDKNTLFASPYFRPADADSLGGVA